MCVSLSLLSAGMAPGAGAAATAGAGGMMQAGASGLGALSSLASGVMQSRSARADAEMARIDGQNKAQRIRTSGQAEVSRSRNDVVGAGVSLNSGSALEAERQVVRNVEQDAGVAILTGEGRAQARQAEGRAAMVNGMLGAIGGSATAFDKWKRASSTAIGSIPLGGGGGYIPTGGE